MVSTGSSLIPIDVSPDLRVLGFTAVISLLTGILFGLAPAFRSTHAELSPTDPATIGLATLLMLVVAAFAGYLPAQRASRIDPIVALRCE